MSCWIYENYFKKFYEKFGKKIINIHPSLIPKFKGLILFKNFKNKEKKTGCTVHYVNEKLDSGNIIAQKSFFINLMIMKKL